MNGARLVLLGLALPLVAAAQPPAVEVIDEVSQYRTSECAWIDIRFLQAVGYLGHFPTDHSNQLRISVQLLNRPDALPAGSREAMHVCPKDPFNVRWATFEAEGQGRGSLYIDFNGETRYKVGQGGDFRSIVISVPSSAGAAPCDPGAFRRNPALEER